MKLCKSNIDQLWIAKNAQKMLQPLRETFSNIAVCVECYIYKAYVH